MPSFKRHPRTNRMSNLDDFLQAWEAAEHSDNRNAVELHVTSFGNINSTGELGNYQGHALSRWQPQFAAALEAGIRELVLLLVNRFHWVTYTSCQGHRYEELALPPVERHVGLAPRDEAERQKMLHVFNQTAALLNKRYRWSPVCLETVAGALESDGRAYPVVDLFFRRRWWASWRGYFACVDEVYAETLQELGCPSATAGEE